MEPLKVWSGGEAKNYIRVMSVDDHPLMREGIAKIISREPDMQLIAQASNGREAISRFRQHQPDITLFDLRLPDMSGIDAMMAIRQEFPDARFVVLTTFDGDVDVGRALAAGAHSYVLKCMPPQELITTIREVHRGRKPISPRIAIPLAEHLTQELLTERELEVLRLVMNGSPNRDIAAHLSVSEETVKTHMKRILDKLGAHDRVQAVVCALRRGFVQL